jgi:hypothetical protein
MNYIFRATHNSEIFWLPPLTLGVTPKDEGTRVDHPEDEASETNLHHLSDLYPTVAFRKQPASWPTSLLRLSICLHELNADKSIAFARIDDRN